MTQEFLPGQRWVNHAELQLGLGTVLSVEHRTVTLVFAASGETRTYSRQTAPLTRMVYGPGDKISDKQGTEIVIQNVETGEDGLCVYHGINTSVGTVSVHESEINTSVSLHGPAERLLAGLVDDSRWFHLRHLALDALDFIHQHPIATITGCRMDLIPHQLYIASEVSQRHAPRVLLADEVGLGKTIEAGLIIHQQLHTEHIRRVLIVVPDNLLHQWLVEMFRRFNLRFSLYDTDRHRDMRISEGSDNPFLEEQLMLCGLHTLTDNEFFFNDVQAAGWDMLVVDEAHHLSWSPGVSSTAYQAIDMLASSTPGVLLLTATPEQLGKTGHFARLRILDPDRFHDYEKFIEEENHYQPVAEAVKDLFDDTATTEDVIERLEKIPGGDFSRFKTGTTKNALIRYLLDLRGTGRVLFRNTRSTVSGFPERKLQSYPLPAPEAYLSLDTAIVKNEEALPSIELRYQPHVRQEKNWTQIDPRVCWLVEILDKLKTEKLLLIAHARQSVIDLADYLRTRHGIHAAIFHEDMTILERDRAAEYFADQESGARIMICSEIGSEGRNFQFVHNLILFDLPLLPDLLEQRIGRLDRIGQQHPVVIHVPYIESTAQEVLFRWYRDGLQAFTTPCQTGQAIYQQYHAQLIDIINKNGNSVDLFIALTQRTNRQLLTDLERGRDRLLEFNSCPPEEAGNLFQQAQTVDQQQKLHDVMESAFDCFGIDSEEHGPYSFILRPGESMASAFPHLPDEGMTITYDRQSALVHENWHFLSWAHPMVTAALDLALSYEKGNATAVSLSARGIDPGSLLLECHYILQVASDKDFVLRHLIAPQVIRLVISEDGTRYETRLQHADIELGKSQIDKVTAAKIVSMKQASIRKLIDLSRDCANEISPAIIISGRNKAIEQIQSDLDRLQALSRVNKNIRQVEIDFLKGQRQKVEAVYDSIVPRLDAIRLLVAT